MENLKTISRDDKEIFCGEVNMLKWKLISGKGQFKDTINFEKNEN